MEKLNRIARRNRVFLLAGILVFLGYMFFVDPANSLLPLCRFRALTGHSCPTCGMTRSIHAFLHASPGEAFRFHLMGPFLSLFLLYVFGKTGLELFRGQFLLSVRGRKTERYALYFLGIAWVVFWLIRMLLEDASLAFVSSLF